MRIRLARPFAAACALFLLAASLEAAGARFWQASTQADFLKGDAQNLAIDQYGRLTLGSELAPVGESTTPFLWTVVAAPDGGVYAGSGNDGQVFHFARDGKRTVFFDAAELEVRALATAPNGGLYVGTSPGGKVYRVDAQGKSSVFFDPDDKYIWALATDASGVVYAATGEKGVIYRITADGKGEVFYKTKATNVTTLLVDRNGDLLAGTESPGKVFRIRKDGSGFVLLDPGLQEITALRTDAAGLVYVAAQAGQAGSGERTSPSTRDGGDSGSALPVPSVSTEITSMTVVDVSPITSGTTTPGREEHHAARGGVYRILADGAWDVLWESSEDAPYDLVAEPGGSLLVATGNKGKIYRLGGEPIRVSLVARADAQQITSMLGDAGGAWLATANPGRLLRLSTAQATHGTFESEVRDAETVATWGTISWRGTSPSGTSVKLFTRSGNTAVPDETWSSWSAAYTRQAGEPVSSPKARYFQWKAELTGTPSVSPLVTSITAAYLQRNLRPQITSITIHPPGVVFQKPFSTGEAEIAGFDGAPPDRKPASAVAPSVTTITTGAPPLGRRGYQKGLQTIIWKADDDNDDDLQYDVLYRREGETSWKPLKRGITDPIFVWDTTSVPNGTYVVKIVASDAPANPPGTSLNGERESRAFDIDNTPPTISVTSVRRDGNRTIVLFTVKDEFSAVQRVEYSVDAERWRPIYPKDGIADSPSEEFELVIEADTTGKAIVLRAADTMNNVATARAEAPAAK